MTTANASLSRAACHYAERGLAVFPLAPRSKVPLRGTHGHKDATSDRAVVDAWWRQHPAANVAIATGRKSGLWVLDIDPRHGGEETLAKLVAVNRPLPVTFETTTPSGGRHLYFALSAYDLEIRRSVGRLGPGLDVLGEGGGVTAPPSVLRNGRRYRWCAVGSRDMAPAPRWLIELACPPPPPDLCRPRRPLRGPIRNYAVAAIVDELCGLERAPTGQRNDALNRAAFSIGGFVRAEVVNETWAAEQLALRAQAIGLTEAETAATIRSAFAAATPRELPR